MAGCTYFDALGDYVVRLKTQLADNAGKMKVKMGDRMDEQAREMQTDPEKFACEFRW